MGAPVLEQLHDRTLLAYRVEARFHAVRSDQDLAEREGGGEYFDKERFHRELPASGSTRQCAAEISSSRLGVCSWKRGRVPRDRRNSLHLNRRSRGRVSYELPYPGGYRGRSQRSTALKFPPCVHQRDEFAGHDTNHRKGITESVPNIDAERGNRRGEERLSRRSRIARELLKGSIFTRCANCYSVFASPYPVCAFRLFRMSTPCRPPNLVLPNCPPVLLPLHCARLIEFRPRPRLSPMLARPALLRAFMARPIKVRTTPAKSMLVRPVRPK